MAPFLSENFLERREEEDIFFYYFLGSLLYKEWSRTHQDNIIKSDSQFKIILGYLIISWIGNDFE